MPGPTTSVRSCRAFHAIGVTVGFVLVIGAGCGGGGGSGGSGGEGGPGAGGATQTGGARGGASQGGSAGGGGLGATPATGGAAGSTNGSGGGPVTGATGGTGGSDAGAQGGVAGGSASGHGGAGGTGAGAAAGHPGGSGGAAGNVVPPGCTLPATVSFKQDVLPFLTKSCGGGNGCHIIDAVSTMGNGGYDHGYDWITAGAHASSCPEKPTPYRYQVTLDVIDAANPPTCSKSRKMPPPGGTRSPLTACELATLKAWLAEPLVTQMHRADDSSPTTPYPMPPFN